MLDINNIQKGSYYSYPDKHVLKKFYEAGGKVVSVKDIFSE